MGSTNKSEDIEDIVKNQLMKKKKIGNDEGQIQDEVLNYKKKVNP